MWTPFHWFFSGVFGIIGFIISLAIYFLPTIIAVARHHRNTLAIFLIDLFLGWTFIGWIVVLIWSFLR